jgi:hypothetical protein
VVNQQQRFVVSDHPVCGAKAGFAEIFLMPQPPLLTRRGMRLAQTADQGPEGRGLFHSDSRQGSQADTATTIGGVNELFRIRCPCGRY